MITKQKHIGCRLTKKFAFLMCKYLIELIFTKYLFKIEENG
jgi:hypothetical protein